MNKALIEDLYKEQFDKMVKRYTRLCNGSEMDAEDIAQETFKRAMEYKETFPEDKEEASRYLNQMSYNCFLANRNEQRRSGTVDYDELEEDALVTEEDKRLVEVKDLLKNLEKVLKPYPEREQEVLRLHFIKRYRCVDIVKIYGFSKQYWNKVFNKTYQDLCALQGRDSYYSKGGWVQ